MAKTTPGADDAYAEALKRIEACRKLGKKGTKLDLSNLGLSALPPEVGRLTALTELYLDGNQLTALPPEVGRLTALTVLYLHDNPGLGLPLEVLGPTWEDVHLRKAKPKPPNDILASYFRIVGEAGEPLGECKL